MGVPRNVLHEGSERPKGNFPGKSFFRLARGVFG